MASLIPIKQLTGAWRGRSSLWLAPGTTASESDTSATITSVAGGKVVAIDYTWTHEGESQDGRILLAIEEVDGVHMAWCDSFHMGEKIMDLAGDSTSERIAATGAYGAPDGEPWGWRIELDPAETGFRMRMYNILPDTMGGTEALAVQTDYTRA